MAPKSMNYVTRTLGVLPDQEAAVYELAPPKPGLRSMIGPLTITATKRVTRFSIVDAKTGPEGYGHTYASGTLTPGGQWRWDRPIVSKANRGLAIVLSGIDVAANAGSNEINITYEGRYIAAADGVDSK